MEMMINQTSTVIPVEISIAIPSTLQSLDNISSKTRQMYYFTLPSSLTSFSSTIIITIIHHHPHHPYLHQSLSNSLSIFSFLIISIITIHLYPQSKCLFFTLAFYNSLSSSLCDILYPFLSSLSFFASFIIPILIILIIIIIFIFLTKTTLLGEINICFLKIKPSSSTSYYYQPSSNPFFHPLKKADENISLSLPN